MTRWIGYALVVVGLTISGCGGGGGGGHQASTTPGSGSSTTNNLPVADAGSAQNVKVGATVTLNGSASHDPDGNTLTYHWTLKSTPGGSTASLNTPNNAKPTFIPDEAGQYVAQLVVNDGKADSKTSSVTIIAAKANSAPVANAGTDQSIKTGSTVTLDGTASSDADGDLLTYQWTLSQVPNGSVATLINPTSVKPTFVPDVDGTYVASLVVNDGQVNSSAATVTITAATPNSAPVADAGADQNATTGDAVTLDGSGSSDADGDPLTYQWQFVSKPSGSTASLGDATSVKPTFTADVAGDYVVQLIVNDGKVDSSADTMTVSVVKANVPPVANAGPDQAVTTGDTVTLDGSASADPDGDTITFQWAFVSKPTGSAATLSSTTDVKPTFVADKAGDYVLSLVVNDGKADSTEDRVTITAAKANAAPVADAGKDQNALTGTVVTLDGTGSSDADGDSLTYAWTVVSLPTGSTASLVNGTSAKPSFTPDVAGSYVFQLVVNDGTVDSAPDKVTVTATRADVAPVAYAGADQSAFTGNQVNLDGSGSSDADGNSLTYQWTFTNLPTGSKASLSAATTASPSFTPDVAGQYVASLVVNDGQKSSTADTVVITVSNPSLDLEDYVPADAFEPAHWEEVGLPFTSSSSLSRTSTSGGTVELDKFRLTAKGQDYTLQSVQVEYPGGSAPAGLNARFEGIQTGQLISKGQQVVFTLNVDQTPVTNLQLRFIFNVSENGQTFQSTYNLTLR